MKYLDQACGLRLKTAVKVIAIIGMVASLIGFSIAINRLTKMPASANHNKTTDAQALTNDTTGDSSQDSTNSIADVPKNEEYLEDNHEEGSSDDIDLETTTALPEGHEHWTDSIEDVHKTEGEEEDAIPRSKREAESNATAGTLIESEGDPVSPVSEKAETSGDNVAIPPLPDLEYDSAEVDEAGQSSVTPGSPPVTAAPKAELSSTTTTTTTVSPTTDIKIEDVTSATEAEEIVEHSEELPESKENNVPELTDEESVHHDEDVTEEAFKETENEQIVQEPHNSDSIEDSSTDEDKDDSETAEDDKESSTSRASWAMTGLGVPICLLGFVANAVLLHAAKKAEKKLLIIWILWAGLLFCYQITAMAVNLHDLSSYIFLNVLLTMLSVGAGYVVLSYSKQLSDPSSYDLKTIEMNGYSMNKGFMELDNKDKEASGSAAGGDHNV